MDTQRYRSLIESAYPEFPVYTLAPIGQGRDFVAIEVNGSHIFRFPKRQDIVRQQEREIRFLPELANVLPVKVPRFDFVSRDRFREPSLFVGYPKIPGEPLRIEELEDAVIRSSLAQNLGETLSTLHGISIGDLKSDQLRRKEANELRQEQQNAFEYVQEHILPLLSPQGGRNGSRLWAEYVANDANFDYDPVIIHGDVGAENILCDYERGHVVGIIDWSFAEVGDPATDFEHLLTGTGESFGLDVLSFYDGEDGPEFIRRIRDLHRLHPYSEVRFGLETGQSAYVQSGVSAIEVSAQGP